MTLEGLIGLYHYFCVFVGDYSKFTWLFGLKMKDEICQAFQKFQAIQENYTGQPILYFFGDNEAALLEKEFHYWLVSQGIIHVTMQTYSPEMNGVTECAIKHVVQHYEAGASFRRLYHLFSLC